MLCVDDDDHIVVAYVENNAPGVEVVDDWSAMGQRGTASGTVRFDSVIVDADRVVPAGSGQVDDERALGFVDADMLEAAERDAD